MPVPSRSHKAEAKYNVTTDFPHLGLHSAAATGNVGLVKYALSHGQPVNSVLDGVLPLHAACSGGNEIVVKLLIENGADVNAPRLPRRYSTDKNRDASAPIVGTSGSTPLHFAAANGHTSVVLTLLLHGAHANRADKHGVTPEILARQNGFRETAELLRDWYMNKDKDLMEREGALFESKRYEKKDRQQSSDAGEASTSKRLQVKRSIDNALNMLKPSSASDYLRTPNTPSGNLSAEPSSPQEGGPLGEYTFYPPSPEENDESHPRRPSLPHIHDDEVTVKPPNSPPSERRPRSAGTGAEQKTHRHRKLTTKYSLLHLFKKAGGDADAASASPYTDSPSSSLRQSPRTAPADLNPSNAESQDAQRCRSRMASDASQQSPRHGITEIRHFTSRDRLRERSDTGASKRSVTGDEDAATEGPSPVRPGILRGHHRSSSSSQSQIASNLPSSARTLRFDSLSTTAPSPQNKVRTPSIRSKGLHHSTSPSRRVHGSSSHSSLGLIEKRPGSAGSGSGRTPTVDSAPATTLEFDTESPNIEEEDEEYGQPIEQSRDSESGSHLTVIQTEVRPRGHSFASSTSSLSPILSPASDVASLNTQFPFSLNNPPPADDVDSQHLTVPKAHSLPRLDDDRLRGDSFSSTSTDASRNTQLSSSTTATSSGSLQTPAQSLSGPLNSSVHSKSVRSQTLLFKDGEFDSEPTLEFVNSLGLNERRAHIPLDIDIRSISSHAQAEALVQRAQQSILNMDMAIITDEAPKSSALGWTPLSAKLAAYGESLAIERRLKREEEERENIAFDEEESDEETSEEGLVPVRSIGAPNLLNVWNGRSRGHSDGKLVPMYSSMRTRSRSRAREKSTNDPSTHEPWSTDAPARAHHQQAPHSASAAESQFPANSLFPDRVTDSPRSSPGLPSTDTLDPSEYIYDGPRSRTPDLEITSNLVGGVPLSRVSTAPVQNVDPRHITSKLTRMGVQPTDGRQQSLRSVSGSTRLPSGKHKFGIKSLMSTLKGKQ